MYRRRVWYTVNSGRLLNAFARCVASGEKNRRWKTKLKILHNKFSRHAVPVITQRIEQKLQNKH